jgi:two-component system chemotaxis sensor kinase CheA
MAILPIAEQLNRQASRLMVSGGIEPAEWLAFLGAIQQQAEAEGLPAVRSVAAELTRDGSAAGTPLDQIAIEKQLVRLQQAVETLSRQPLALSQDPDLIRDFITESRDHLQSVERLMLALEGDPTQREPLHGTFRAVHTIKGLAGFLELDAIQAFSHEVETLLDQARNGHLEITPRLVDVVLASADHLAQNINLVDAALNGGPAGTPPDSTALLVTIRELQTGESSTPATEKAAERAPAALSGADQPESQPSGSATSASAKEVQPGKATVSAPAEPAPAKATSSSSVAAGPAAVKKDAAAAATSSVKVDTAKLDFLVDMVGELVIAQSLVRHNPELAALNNPILTRNIAQLARITDEVQKTAMSMRMVPLDMLFQKMVRLVRDLSRKSNKAVEMEIEGEETELDRNIVEALADPLMHMVRNSMDHGIETSDERAKSGKPAVAKVRLKASHQAGSIVILIADDGRGISREKVIKKARERGLIESGDQLSDSEVFNLIFEPGFSTAEKITDISGRGVGMDVVKKHIQKLRGRIDIRSKQGAGTEFELKVPLTLAIIEGLVVGVGAERYIMPIYAVREMLRPSAGMVSTMEGRHEVALVRGHVLPVVRLAKRFGVVPKSEVPEESLMVIAEARGRDFCLIVDDLLGKQEVVIKSLGDGIRAVPGIAGGAIMGDGRVGLILDMNGVFSSEGLEGDARAA